MTSRLQIAPQPMHTRVANLLWLQKETWVDPNSATASIVKRKQPPNIKKIARFGYERKPR